MKPKRILHIFPYYIPPDGTNSNGVKRVVITCLRGADRARFEPIVVCPAPSPFDQDFQEAGGRIVYLENPRHMILQRTGNLLSYAGYVPRFWKYRRQFRSLLQELQPAVVHSHVSAFLGAAAAAKSLGIPSLVHVHEGGERLRPWMYAAYNRAVMHWADHMILVASYLKHYFKHLAVRGKVTVINNGVHLDYLSPRRPTPSLREQWRIAPGEIVLGYLGRMAPRKGVHLAIEAFAKVHLQVPAARLVIVGDTDMDYELPYKRALLQRVKELSLESFITFAGARRDVADVLDTFDIQIFTSPIDYCPLAVIEGMAMSKAIVAAGRGGVEDMLRDDDNGILLPPGHPDRIADAILRLIEDPILRAKLGKAAARTVRQRLTGQAFCAAVETVYNEMLA